MSDLKEKRSDTVHRSIRLTHEEAQIADKMGGVTKSFRRFLREKVLHSKDVAEEIRNKSERLAEIDAVRGKLFDEIGGLRNVLSSLQEGEKRHLEGTDPMFDLAADDRQPSPPIPQSSRNGRSKKIITRREWEEKFKIFYLLVYATTGSITEANKQNIINRLRLKPNTTALEWLLGPSPESVSLNTLEYSRTGKHSRDYNFQNIKEKGLISPEFYGFLMKWLHANSKEEVDARIMNGGCMESVRDSLYPIEEARPPSSRAEPTRADQPLHDPSSLQDTQSQAIDQTVSGIHVPTEQNRAPEDVLLKVVAANITETRVEENNTSSKVSGV